MRNILIRYAITYHGNYFRIRNAIKNKESADKSIRIQKAITILDDDYPQQLRQLRYPPYVLFYIGDKQLLSSRMIAVVGTRQPSVYGVNMTKLAVNAIREKVTVVSGMAKGIDAIAHREAIHTIGILGNGLNINYPIENASLYADMRLHQLLLSEYPLDERPQRYYFPFRNRIIAALSERVIVTQAAIRSGSLLTVNEALALGREIDTFPYPFDDPAGQGCNQLIEQGANILTNTNIQNLLK